jgi:hypothetical protein
MSRVLGSQHKIARGVLRVGQIADKTSELVGQVGLDSHPVGSVVRKGLKAFSGFAPKLAVLAESGGELMSAGKDLKRAFEKKDISGALGAGKRAFDIGKKAYDTKAGDVSLKSKSGGGGAMMRPAVMPASSMSVFGSGDSAW